MLIEHPHSWGPKALQDSTIPLSVKKYLSQILKIIPRSKLLLIKQDISFAGDFTVFVVRSHESNPSITKFTIKNYEQLRDLDIALVMAGSSLNNGVIFEKPLYVVCTHGRRDKCCAKYGFPIYKTLRKYTGNAVWQSSHVGGDRFAANVVCFPHGLFYAHVTEDAGKKVIDAYEQGQLALDRYRGRACYSYPVQAAEFFIRSQAGITGIGEIRYLDSERVEEEAWRVRFIATGTREIHEAIVIRVMSDFQNYNTCHSTEEKRVVQYQLGDYRLISDQSLVQVWLRRVHEDKLS